MHPAALFWQSMFIRGRLEGESERKMQATFLPDGYLPNAQAGAVFHNQRLVEAAMGRAEHAGGGAGNVDDADRRWTADVPTSFAASVWAVP